MKVDPKIGSRIFETIHNKHKCQTCRPDLIVDGQLFGVIKSNHAAMEGMQKYDFDLDSGQKDKTYQNISEYVRIYQNISEYIRIYQNISE